MIKTSNNSLKLKVTSGTSVSWTKTTGVIHRTAAIGAGASHLPLLANGKPCTAHFCASVHTHLMTCKTISCQVRIKLTFSYQHARWSCDKRQSWHKNKEKAACKANTPTKLHINRADHSWNTTGPHTATHRPFPVCSTKEGLRAQEMLMSCTS